MIGGCSSTLIRYSLNDFIALKPQHTDIPDSLSKYINKKGQNTVNLRDTYTSDMSDLINAIMSNINPEDIHIKNNIREYLNKINKNNSTQYIQLLKSLNFSTINNLNTLIIELITRAINDMLSVKGMIDDTTITDTIVEVILAFYDVALTIDDKQYKFTVLFKIMCKKYLDDSLKPSNALDANNQYRVDNFKGFMNLIGVLYTRQILNNNHIIECCDDLINSLKSKFSIDATSVQCQNMYVGYQRLINQLLKLFETQQPDKKFIEKILQLNSCIINSGTFKPFIIVTNNEIKEKLIKLTL